MCDLSINQVEFQRFWCIIDKLNNLEPETVDESILLFCLLLNDTIYGRV